MKCSKQVKWVEDTKRVRDAQVLHTCGLEEGHEGLHRCGVCLHTWAMVELLPEVPVATS